VSIMRMIMQHLVVVHSQLLLIQTLSSLTCSRLAHQFHPLMAAEERGRRGVNEVRHDVWLLMGVPSSPGMGLMETVRWPLTSPLSLTITTLLTRWAGRRRLLRYTKDLSDKKGSTVEAQQRSTHAMQEWLRHSPPTNSPSNQPDPGIPVIEGIFAREAETR